MSSSEVKIEIQNLINDVEDVNFLNYIKNYISTIKLNSKKDWGKNIPEEDEKRLLKSLSQLKNRKTISHLTVKADLKKQFPHLNL